MITASALTRIAACPPSAALPRVSAEANAEMRRGSAVHLYLEHATTMGRDAALALVPAEHRETCEAIDFAKLPVTLPDPRLRSEEALVYDVLSERTRSLGLSIDRRYGDLGAYEIAGTPDLWWLAADGVHVLDWKVGYGSDLYAPPPARNLQLLWAGLALARLTGADEAWIARCRIDLDGRIHMDEWHVLSALDLDMLAGRLRRLVDSVARARETVELGRTPDVTPGEHCRYCPAWESCPAKAALVRQMAVAPADLERAVLGMLTPENAVVAYRRADEVRALLARVDSAIAEYARRTGGIDLGDGRVFGPVSVEKESIDGGLAYAVLEQEYGRDVAEAAVQPTASKTSVQDALRGFVARGGGKLAPVMREAMGLLREAGAVTVTTAEQMKEHKA